MIGRIEEIKRLKAAYASEQSEFVTIYGRRRIGKTFLVNETFGYKFAFHHAGLKRQGLKEQLEQFRFSLMRQGYAQCPVFRSWLEAFYHLEVFLEKRPRGRKVVLVRARFAVGEVCLARIGIRTSLSRTRSADEARTWNLRCGDDRLCMA